MKNNIKSGNVNTKRKKNEQPVHENPKIKRGYLGH